MRETDLFKPVSDYLNHHGYEVNAEVKDCDIVATRDDAIIIIELKTSANMQLLVQATKRQHITDSVYVAIPDPGNNRRFKGVQRVLKQLELGLLIVTDTALGPNVIKLFDPLPYKRRKVKKRRSALIEEIADRSANYNVGGSTRTKLMTAYREQAIYIATCLQELGPGSPKSLRELGASAKTQNILSDNHYHWFQRIDRGVYKLTQQGSSDLKLYQEFYERSKEVLATNKASSEE
ncbi:MAG TPA: hypothetical protein DCM54_04515 [Gammaproteobacteria bacterium]|nr:hypothetical protein [Gammaproteobacteria bacterium]